MQSYIDKYRVHTKTLTQEEKNQLVIDNAPLVKKIAYRIATRLPPNIEPDDLISVGVIGLIDAIQKYDPDKETKFSTYAEIRIKGAILDELRSQDWVPRSVRQKATELSAIYCRLEQEKGRPATDEEVAEVLGVDINEFNDILRHSAGIKLLSLEDMGGFGKDGEKRNILECLAGTKDTDPHTLARISEIKEILARSIDDLPEKERLLVSIYYYEELTMKEIGQVMGITESRVSQIHTKAVLRLKGKLKKFFEV